MERKDAIALLAPLPALGISEDLKTEVKCAFCREIESKLPGHQWTENDCAEDQLASSELVDDLAAEIRKFLAYPKTSTLRATKRGTRFMTTPDTQRVTLRDKIERIIDTRQRLVPEIVGELCRALRELAATANALAERLEDDHVSASDAEIEPPASNWKKFDEIYVRGREAYLLRRIEANKVLDKLKELIQYDEYRRKIKCELPRDNGSRP